MKAAGLFICTTAIIVIISGCFNPPQPVYEQPTVDLKKIFETVYVDPQLIHSDSLLSIIRADRVDSIIVNDDYQLPTGKITSLSFQIETDNCMAFIWVINNNGDVLLKISDRLLNKGFYKVSCNLKKINDPFVLSQGLFLKADICGKTIIEPIRR